jgi:hypothetical protein
MAALSSSVIAGCWMIFLTYWYITALAVKRTV